jgi:hypothetical protein
MKDNCFNSFIVSTPNPFGTRAIAPIGAALVHPPRLGSSATANLLAKLLFRQNAEQLFARHSIALQKLLNYESTKMIEIPRITLPIQ